MSFIDDIKSKLFQRRMTARTRAPGKRKVGEAPLSFKLAKRVIVLFPADDSADRKAVTLWKERTQSASRQIRLVGHFAKDFGTAAYDFTAISPKEKTWFGAPKGEMTKRYLEEECDLLIRLGPPTHHRLDYLAAVKRASMKVGPYRPEHTHIYQLQFDGETHTALSDQLSAIEAIFSFTNAEPT